MKKIFLPIIALLLLASAVGLAIDINKAEPIAHKTHTLVVATPEIVPFTREGLLSGINEYRKSEGKKPLTINIQLNESAQLKANDMQKNHYWGHVSPSGVEPWGWFDKAEYSYKHAGENLAKCYPDDKAAVEAWWNSPTHKANMLDDYTETGFGFVHYEEDCVVIVEHFGRQ